MERKGGGHEQASAGLLDTIRQLTIPPQGKKRLIGFTVDSGAGEETA